MLLTHMPAQHHKLGAVGEKAVLNHLKRKGYVHLESNFRAVTGEIDVVVEKDGVVHFVEVKTVARGTDDRRVSRGTYRAWKPDVTRATRTGLLGIFSRGTYRAEENVHKNKLRKLLNTIQIWLSVNKYEGKWQLDVAAVHLNPEAQTGTIKLIENVVVE